MKVLIIEDDAANADLLSTRLKNLDCQVLVAADVADAWRLATQGLPDLILLDLKLGHTISSGTELLADLRTNPVTAHIPVIIHSIYLERPGDLPQAEAMANGHLLKPFKFEDLKAIIAGFQAVVR
jgi:CheY-like chemotaxis protein